MAATETEICYTESFDDHSKNVRHGVGVIEIVASDSKSSFLVEGGDNQNAEPKKLFSRSEVHRMYHSFPFGFRNPDNVSSGVCRWVYPISFGGGLVGGDQIEARFVIGQRCCVTICTQGSTKVYHCRQTTETTSQSLDFTLESDCLLCVLPDPLVCYADARFHQTQTFHLCPTSNLVLLDWIQDGRRALGESWHFERYCSTIEIYFSNKLVLRECNNMENNHLVNLNKSMGKFQFLGTCIILGPYLTFLTHAIQEAFGGKKGFGESQSDSLVVSMSPLSYSVDGNSLHGCYLRFLAKDIKAASVVISTITKPLMADLGADPFENKL